MPLRVFMKKILPVLFLIACFGNIAYASGDAPGLVENWFAAMKRTVENPTTFDIYRPLNVHHMRWNFTDEQIARYNETPGGLGLGISRVEGYHEHFLYAMGFADSHSRFQGVFGYGWLASVFKPGSFFNISGGFTISAQMRNEYYYIPIPLPLPVAGVDVGPLSLQGAYVPGWRGFGNISIIWLNLKIPLKWLGRQNPPA